MSDLPSGMHLTCPLCGETVYHTVVKGRISKSFDGVVRCSACRHTYHCTVPIPKEVTVPLMLSWMEDTERTCITAESDEVLHTGQVLELPEGPVKITAIEVEGRRVKQAPASEIKTLWGVRYHRVVVGVSVLMGRRTLGRRILVPPDREFRIGERIMVEGHPCIISQIRLRDKTLKRGSALAEETVRLYVRRWE